MIVPDGSPFDPRPDVRALFRVKAAALLVVAASLWPLRWFGAADLHAAEGTLAILADLVPTVAVLLWRGPVPATLLGATFAVDLLAITAGVHWAGGVDSSSMPIVYPIVIAMAGLLLSEHAGYLTAGASALLYGAVALAEHEGWLPRAAAFDRPVGRQISAVVLTSLFLVLYAGLVAFVARALRRSFAHAEELRNEAVTALSHDIRTPLAVIGGYAGMLGEVPDAERPVLARRIERASAQALDLVQNVLDASRFAGGALTVEHLPLDVNAVVRQVHDLYASMAEAKDVVLEIGEAALPPVDADPRLLERALGNLVSNAVKFTPRGGRVSITTGHAGTDVIVRVRDSGPGIAAGEQARLFQKYSRASSGRGVEGTGLGLYIVRLIAEAHRGSVTIASSAGAGSEFVLTLPIHQAV